MSPPCPKPSAIGVLVPPATDLLRSGKGMMVLKSFNQDVSQPTRPRHSFFINRLLNGAASTSASASAESPRQNADGRSDTLPNFAER